MTYVDRCVVLILTKNLASLFQSWYYPGRGAASSACCTTTGDACVAPTGASRTSEQFVLLPDQKLYHKLARNEKREKRGVP